MLLQYPWILHSLTLPSTQQACPPPWVILLSAFSLSGCWHLWKKGMDICSPGGLSNNGICSYTFMPYLLPTILTCLGLFCSSLWTSYHSYHSGCSRYFLCTNSQSYSPTLSADDLPWYLMGRWRPSIMEHEIFPAFHIYIFYFILYSPAQNFSVSSLSCHFPSCLSQRSVPLLYKASPSAWVLNFPFPS